MIIRNYLPKIISLLLLWGLVAGVIVYVDPQSIRDIGVEGLYLPLLIAVLLAVWYSMTLLTRSGWVGLVSALLVDLALVLLIIKVFNMLTGVAILSLIVSMSYFAINRNSKLR